MAIWQVALYLTSKKHIDISNPAFESSLKKLEMFFTETKSWCKNIKQYGELDSTCIEIDIDSCDDISVRIDLRSISKNQLTAILDFALDNDLCIKYNDNIYETCMESFVSIFRESDANKFLLCPEKFLKETSESNLSN